MNASRPSPKSSARRGVSLAEVALALACLPFALFLAVRRWSGHSGLARIGDDQVGVVIDQWSGARELVTTPGYRAYLPWLQEVETLDRAPNTLVFAGNEPQDRARTPRLIVRARDGSTCWFENLTVLYGLRSERAPRVLDDAGSGQAWKSELVAFYARSILRDEFGRFGTLELAQVQYLRSAVRAAQERLDRALEPHGIEVLEISTPQPSFDKAYEDHIRRRKLNDQESARLSAALDGLAEERHQLEAAAQRVKEVEYQKLGDHLEHDLKAAHNDEVRMRAEAERYYLERVRAAEATGIEKQTAAAALRERYTREAADLEQQARDLERYGELGVRMALVDKLASIEFSLVPYSRDPAPQRIELLQASPLPVNGVHP
ncbi:MAG: hypothetical protein IPJ19_12655 [Planctomycetes bacterium]|nr:hypothetical protein [Planctomycetota bacterium]